MKETSIIVKGKTYPCRVTLRAMLKFKQLTGRDWGALEGNGVTDMITFLWCCVWATCVVDGIEFDYDLDEFSGHLDGEVFGSWVGFLGDSGDKGTSTPSGKKKASR